MDGTIADSGGATLQTFQPDAIARQVADIEALLWWAYEQTSVLPFRGVHPRELMLDGGYTVIPKGCSREYHAGTVLLRRAVDDDAAAVIEAVRALPSEVRDVVRACAMQRIRPNWMEGVEPRLVTRVVSWRKRRKKGHRSLVEKTWKPCHPDTIRAVRAIYSDWHAAVAGLAASLSGALNCWQINGFDAHATPWLPTAE